MVSSKKPATSTKKGGPTYNMSEETLVNADYRAGNQQIPTIAPLSGGGYVVAWRDDGGRDGHQYGVFAQRLDSAGARVGREFQVNAYTRTEQEEPTAAGLPDGGYMIVWSSRGQDGSSFGVFGKKYAADGSPAGAEFRINTVAAEYQANPSIAVFADGGFVAAWTDLSGINGDGYGISAQRFAADGTRVGPQFRVNTHKSNIQIAPVVAVLAGGGFAIAWNSIGQDGSGYGVYGQQYAADGSTVGSEFRVNTRKTSDQDTPAVTGLASGGFVVLWESEDQDGSGDGIFGQMFDKNGRAIGSEFQVNSYTDSDQKRPAVTVLDDGGFMATWESDGQDHSAKGVFGQRFDANGSKVGGEFRINKSTNNMQHQPEITTLSDGRVAVTWTSSAGTGYYDIYTRIMEVPTSPVVVNGNNRAVQLGKRGNDTLTGGDGRDFLNGKAGNDSLAGGGGSDRLRGDRGDDSLSGGAARDILLGDQGNDSLSGDAGWDVLRGGSGDDTLTGGAGRDRYAFARGDGADSIDNADTARTQDTLLFKAGIGHDQLWFARSGQDLMVSVIGTADAVTVEDWYASADNRHLTITTEDRKASLADSQVQALVTAMASHAPPALGTLTLSSATHGSVETVIAASWQLGG